MDRIDFLLILTEELQQVANDNLNNISQDLFNMTEAHHFVLKQEVIAEKAYWSGKRRYAMYIVNKEGVEIEELEMKGLDIDCLFMDEEGNGEDDEAFKYRIKKKKKK